MAEAIQRQDFKRDFASGASYFKFSDAPVAATSRIEQDGEAFLADYDAAGAVRGVEFLGGRRKAVEHYREIATRQAKSLPVPVPGREKRV